MSQILSQKQSTLKVIHLLILPKPLVFLLGSIMPLFAQNLSTPLLMMLPRFLTLSSSTEDVSIFTKLFAEIPLKLFTLYTIKTSKQSIKKQSTPPVREDWRDAYRNKPSEEGMRLSRTGNSNVTTWTEETKTPPAILTDGGSVFLNHETNHLSASATN